MTVRTLTTISVLSLRPKAFSHTYRLTLLISGVNQRGEIPWPDRTLERRGGGERAWASNPQETIFLSRVSQAAPQPNLKHRYRPTEGRQTASVYRQRVCRRLWCVSEKLPRAQVEKQGATITLRWCPCREEHTVQTHTHLKGAGKGQRKG